MSSILEKESSDFRPEEITNWHNLTEKYPEIPEKYHPMADAYIQAEEISRGVESELESNPDRLDLRDLPTVTIDPDYAHDHDDAVSMVGDTAYAHIADVAHYVEEGSPIDEAARDRGVTFYLGDNTRHMLPRRLAQDICSLSPGADRLAHTVEMELNDNGEVEDYDIYKSVIESDAHLTYPHSDSIIESSEEILDRFETAEKNVMDEEAQTFEQITQSLDNLESATKDRRENNWDSCLYLNKQPTSGRIIQEMMILANQTVGEHLRDEGIGAYRVEEAPERGWTDEVASELAELGYEPPAELHENPAGSLNDFVRETVEEGDESQVRTAIVTKLPPAKYEARGLTPAGHFGLGTTDYAHFTSPIRRAVDLVNHRIVAETFDGDRGDVSELAEHVTGQQDAADDAAMAWYDANT